jgi:hypothetical protein
MVLMEVGPGRLRPATGLAGHELSYGQAPVGDIARLPKDPVRKATKRLSYSLFSFLINLV